MVAAQLLRNGEKRKSSISESIIKGGKTEKKFGDNFGAPLLRGGVSLRHTAPYSGKDANP